MVQAHAGLWVLLAGVVVFAGEADCLRGSALVAELKAKAKAALLNPTETVEEVVTVEGDVLGGNGTASNVTIAKTKSLLTGNPQKDYIYDPNLPRELNGYNLTNYPFYNGVPDDIDFKCDDLHDGFYASVPHKCQVYHHCLFGTRYDFLCANYTAFDQRTFICHFVSEVDCDNSPKFYQRNEALYKAAATTSPPIVLMTTTTTAAPSTTAAPQPQRPRRRRPYRRRRPVYEYYYDDQYDEDEYYDDEPPPPRRKMNRKHRPQGGYRDDEDDYYDGRRDSSRGENSRAESSRGDNSRGEGSRGDGFSDSSKEGKATLRISGPASGTVYDRPRVPPKIRRPVPIHERDKYDYTQKTSDGGPPPTQDPKKGSKSPSKPEEEEDEYYDDDYEDDYVKPLSKRGKTGSDYEPGSKSDSRRPIGRNRPRQHSRRRPDRYDDDYEVGRPAPRKRPRHEDPPQTSRGSWGYNRGYSREEPDPVPAERPGFISSGRFSPGNRKRTDEDRSQVTGKRPSTRVVYDDDEEEEEYYDDEEEDTPDNVGSQRNQKPISSHSGNNGRRNDDYEAESGRKYLTSNRKQSSESPRPTSRSDTRSSSSGSFQGDNTRGENVKPQNRQKPETTSYSRGTTESECKNDCDEDYSDEPVVDSRQENRKGIDRDGQKRNNDRDSQKQNSDRDRVFSSRFREPQNDSKTKQQSYSPTGSGRPSSPQTNYRTTTQSPEPPQRSKPQSRTKPDSDDIPVTPKLTSTTTTTVSSEDYSDESSPSSNSKYSNFRSKSRVIPPTPLINNYKPVPTTEEPYEMSEVSNSNQNPGIKASNVEEPIDFADDRTVVSPRPFSGSVRRPSKPTTEAITQEEIPVSPKTTSSDLNYRQPAIVNEEDEKTIRKVSNTGQNYRRVKVDPQSYENRDYNQQKPLNIGINFRRPIKPVEEINPDDMPNSEGNQNPSDSFRKGIKPDKPQNEPGYGVYRRVKVSAISSPAPEVEVSTPMSENTQSFQGAPLSNPVNNYKRPYLVSKPLSNYPVVVEDTTKNSFQSNGPFRRPIKQRIQDDVALAGEQYNPAQSPSGLGENYRNAEPSLPVNLRTNLGYFPPKRGKIRIDENSATGLEQFPKQLNLNQEDQFSKQSPKIEITAPGPSAPDVDIATVKSNYKNDYNNPPPGFSLDIPEEEYDVTLNDALQPSTLHPTRSLVDYQQNRLKTRDYQSSIARSPEYVNRGRVSYLLPAASQQYITRVQTVFSPEKQEEAPITARYTDKNSKKGTSIDQEEYEAVVLTAPNTQWPNQRRNRPTEWFW